MPMDPPDGFVEFVTSRSPSLLRTAWLLTGDRGQSEDVLQLALAATWPRWARVTAGGNPEAYVRKAMVNAYLSWWRRRWFGEISMSDPGVDQAPPGPDVAAEVAARDAVRRALGRLSRQQRAVVVLRYMSDLSVAETADLLGCSEATLKGR